jgi:hypothetical protein
MISGALNHLELTWLERHLDFLDFLGRVSDVASPQTVFYLLARTSGRVLERPKSQNLTWQDLFIRIFAGFKSLWITLADEMKFAEHNRL